MKFRFAGKMEVWKKRYIFDALTKTLAKDCFFFPQEHYKKVAAINFSTLILAHRNISISMY